MYPDKTINSRLKAIFSSGTIVRRAGGKTLKVSDFDAVQAFGTLQSNNLTDKYTRLYNNTAINQGGAGMGIQVTRPQLYVDYEAMDTDAICSKALDILSEEATQKNEIGEVLSVRSSNEGIQDELYNLYNNILDIETNLPAWIRNMCKYGDTFLAMDMEPGIGVYGVTPLSVYSVTREEALDANNQNYIRFIISASTVSTSASSAANSGREDSLENFQVAHFRLLSDANFMPYGRCLPKNSYIETENGVKTIDLIKEGDKVWTYNINKDKYELSTVLKQVCSGEKDIVKIYTKNNFIESSLDHPILVYSEGELVYKKAQDVTISDLLAISDYSFKPKTVPSRINKDLGEDFNKNGWKNNIKNIPDFFDTDFARLFGFMLGDGWITRNRVSFAQGVDDSINKKYRDILEKYTGKPCSQSRKCITNTSISSQVVCDNRMLTAILRNNGFKGNAYTKRFPSWIYEQPEDIQIAFIDGFVDADGSVTTDKWGCNRYTIELANKEMLEDLKVLLNRLKIKSGFVQKRKYKDTTTINGIKCNKSQAYLLSFYMDGSKKKQTKLYKKEGIDNIILDPISKICTEESKITYDIQVESSNSNFIANGIVVHNSWLEPARKVFKQYILLKDAAILHRVMRAPEKRIFYYNIGNLAPNEVEPFMQKQISQSKKAPLFDQQTGNYNLKYSMMNMLDDFHIPVRNNDTTTRIDTAKGLEYAGMDDIYFFQNELLAALGVPKAFLNYSDELNGKSTLSGLSMNFSKSIERIQRIVIKQLEKIGQVHLIMLGYDESDLSNFKLKLTTPSTLVEQEKIALLKEKVSLAGDIMEKGLFSSDWIGDNIFSMSEDQILQERELIVEDKKRKFRFKQIEEEGNDPAISGVSYGTPHDLASIYKNNASGPNPGVPDEKDLGKKVNSVGRPITHASAYGTDRSPFGRDPLGKTDNKIEKTSNKGNNIKAKPYILEQSLIKDAKNFYNKKVHLFENEGKVVSFLDEENIIGL